MSVSAGATAVRRGQISAVEVISSALDRSESSQDTLNTYTLIDREGALERAEIIDEMAARGQDPGPLAGVPIALKDLIDQAGLPTTCGSGFYERISDRSATVVERLEAAGAVIIGRTGLHEFAYGFSSENHWFGPVRNPWDTQTSPGGSSGGSAVAVAAGLAAAAIGTDTGGSVRVPAGMCGIVGLKVTHGRVPLTGVFPLALSLDTVGPLGRSVEDVALLYAALAGHDPNDPWSAPRPVPTPGEVPPDLSGIRIGLPYPWISDAPTTPGVATAFATAIDRISDAGAIITALQAPALIPSPHGGSIVGGEAAKVHRPWFGKQPYGPAVAERLRTAFEVTIDQYIDALEWTAKLRNATAAVFQDVDLLMTPTVAATRKVIGEPTIDGIPYRRVLSWFSSLVNHIGVPALSVPLRAPGTPPPSLQLVAPWWAEKRLFAVGRALETLGIATFSAPPIP
ncbi:MAG: amidase [Gammaproteobacteria bacterium]|nr:amidase [Gammaproteobacteria bacterium]